LNDFAYREVGGIRAQGGQGIGAACADQHGGRHGQANALRVVAAQLHELLTPQASSVSQGIQQLRQGRVQTKTPDNPVNRAACALQAKPTTHK
jgi:hypothetical protein